MRQYHSPEPIILSVGEENEVSIADVAKNVANTMDFKGNIVFDATKSDGQYKKTADNMKLRSMYPDFKFTSIEDGLRASSQWFVDNYEIARKGH